MAKYKLIDFGYQDYGEEDWDEENDGYSQEATLVATVQNTETNAKYNFFFEDVRVYTAVSNYRHSAASLYEDAWDDYIERYMELEGDCNPVVYDVVTLSGPALDDDEPTEEEQIDILNQIGSGYIAL